MMGTIVVGEDEPPPPLVPETWGMLVAEKPR